MAHKDDMDMHATNKGPRSDGESSGGSGRKSSPSAAHKALITRNLRLAYGEVASEPLPQNLLDLLARIDDGEDKS